MDPREHQELSTHNNRIPDQHSYRRPCAPCDLRSLRVLRIVQSGSVNVSRAKDRTCPISRLLLVAHTASPLDLQYARILSRAIDQLIDTLEFAYKYRLEPFEKWTCQAITHICTQRDLLKTSGPELYVAPLEMDLLCR
jgi:hypothetical protein